MHSRLRTIASIGVNVVVALLCATMRVWAAGAPPRVALAAKAGDTAAVRTLLADHADVNVPQPDGATALHWAAHHDDLEMAALLIRVGAQVNAANDLGVTALSLACANASAGMVDLLLKAGANPNAESITLPPPLLTAARTGNIQVVRALLDHGARVDAREAERNQTALMWAAAQGHPAIVQALIARGADVNARSQIRRQLINRGGRAGVDEVENGGFTPLLFAARSGDIESARHLLAAGAGMNDESPEGATPLIVAAHSGHGPLAAFLIDLGADPNRSAVGYSALHAAVLRGDLTLVEALLSHNADAGARIERATPVPRFGQDFAFSAELVGATPFALAAKYAEVEIMRALIAAHADTSMPMSDGTTPLMAAAGLGWIDLGAGGGADRRGRFLNTVATAEAHDWDRTLAAVRIVVEAGADVNATNQAGDTALHGAAAKGFNSVIEYLASRGANLEARNRRGQTPLRLAGQGARPEGDSRVGVTDTASVLRRLGAKQ